MSLSNKMNPNLKIKRLNNYSNKCLIAFTSHAADIESKFEFENLLRNKRVEKHFNKIIFLRDIKREFYINGIDSEIDTIDKLLQLLQFETEGKETYVIGVSSGGYMSFLSSIFLNNVTRCVSLGGMIDITTWKGSIQTLNVSEFDCIQKASPGQKKYFNLSNMFHNCDSNIYAFYSGIAKSDVGIINDIKDNHLKNINVMKLNTEKHGDYCYPFDYKYLLTKPDKKLRKIFEKYKNKCISPLTFSLALEGPFLFIYNFTYKLFRGLLRRIRR